MPRLPVVLTVALLCAPALADHTSAPSLHDAFLQVHLLEVNEYRTPNGGWETQVLLRRAGGQIAEWHYRRDCHCVAEGVWWISDNATAVYVRAQREVYTRTEYDVEVDERDMLPVWLRVPYTRAVQPWRGW